MKSNGDEYFGLAERGDCLLEPSNLLLQFPLLFDHSLASHRDWHALELVSRRFLGLVQVSQCLKTLLIAHQSCAWRIFCVFGVNLFLSFGFNALFVKFVEVAGYFTLSLVSVKLLSGLLRLLTLSRGSHWRFVIQGLGQVLFYEVSRLSGVATVGSGLVLFLTV